VVSTDDQGIAAIAADSGAEIPFSRPSSLSDDHTGTLPVVAHAVRWMLDASWPLDAVCCIYATAPFIETADIQRGLEILNSGEWDYVFTATEFEAPIFRAFHSSPDGGVEMFFPEHFTTRSQDLPEALHDAGQFYWGRPDAWLQQHHLFAHRSFPLVIPRWRVHDMDTEADWQRAELVFKALRRQEVCSS
jgi:N-acylneuraminate cytidylyltransferase